MLIERTETGSFEATTTEGEDDTFETATSSLSDDIQIDDVQLENKEKEEEDIEAFNLRSFKYSENDSIELFQEKKVYFNLNLTWKKKNLRFEEEDDPHDPQSSFSHVIKQSKSDKSKNRRKKGVNILQVEKDHVRTLIVIDLMNGIHASCTPLILQVTEDFSSAIANAVSFSP